MTIDETLNNWTPEQLALDQAKSQHPVRYLARATKLPFITSCWWWIIKRKWYRYTTDFEPVFYGDPRYDAAPFEAMEFKRRFE